MPNRTVFYVSDGTGSTAETFGNSILAQFSAKPRHVRRPFIDTVDKADKVVSEINATFEAEGKRPIVFITMARDDVRDMVTSSRCKGLVMDMFRSFVEPLEVEFGLKSNHRVGRFSDAAKSDEYNDRIEAINFSLAHDDGQSAKNLEAADVILVGVSRSGKTPTSPVSGHAAWHQGRQLPAHSRRLRAQPPAEFPVSAQAQVFRPDDRPGPPVPDPQ